MRFSWRYSAKRLASVARDLHSKFNCLKSGARRGNRRSEHLKRFSGLQVRSLNQGLAGSQGEFLGECTEFFEKVFPERSFPKRFLKESLVSVFWEDSAKKQTEKAEV